MRIDYKSLCTLLLGCTLVLWSCSKDQDVAPVETAEGDPAVQITEPAANANIRGNVTIKATVKLSGAKSTLDKVTVTVDNVVLKELKDVAVSLDWNSETVAGGAHTLKVVATTASGKAAESTVTVNVDNTPVLAEFMVPSDYLGNLSTNSIWYFASDEQGALIDIVQVHPGAKATLLRRNDFKGDTFTMTGVVVGSYNGNTSTSFNTMTGFKAGSYTIPPAESDTRTSVGTATVAIVGFPGGNTTGYEFFAPASNLAPNYVTNDQIYKGNLYRNPAAYLVRHYITGNAPEYMTGKIVPGDNLTRSVSDMIAMDHSDITFTKGTQSSINLSGYRDDGFYPSYYYDRFNMSGPTAKPMYFPGLFFSSYALELYSFDGNTTYYQVISNTKTLPTAMEYLDCTIEGLTVTENNSYKAGIQGSCDYVSSKNSQATGSNILQDWQVWTAPNVTFTMPTIPEILRTTYSTVNIQEFNKLTTLESIATYDYAEMDGYAGFVKKPYYFMGLVAYPGTADRKTTTWFKN